MSYLLILSLFLTPISLVRAISVSVGYIIIAGSLLFKVPQVGGGEYPSDNPYMLYKSQKTTHDHPPEGSLSLSLYPSQVVRISRKKSAYGIFAYVYCMKIVGVAISLLFSIRKAFPFSTYGKALFILLQNIAIRVGE